MARTTPQVHDGVVRPQAAGALGAPVIAVGSPEWYAWLECTGTFAFVQSSGSFTARKERRRGGQYWYAYRRRQGTLHSAYLGKTKEVSLARLEEVAQTLTELATVAASRHATEGAWGSREAAPPVQRPVLLSTKLALPPLRGALVARPRLAAQLDDGVRGPLTVISAPPGFGKTTLLQAWRQTEPGAAWPLAWLALDAADNDPARFVAYVIAALQTAQAEVGSAAQALLLAPGQSASTAILTALVNDLAALSGDLVLVLDDYHVIDARAVHDAVAFLVEHLPPCLHLVIAGRVDPPLPLSRLRARGQLAEIRAADLRFTPEEARVFVREVMGLDLPGDAVAALDERTEGWVAGLQLAALALRGSADVPGFIAAFAGSHRYVVDYLADEVLRQQPEDVRAFLLRTAILDRLCGPLCDAVTDGSDGQTLLERLERANLFLIPLDGERRWYRYHHLFADVLRYRLRQEQPALEPELHKRASRWYARQPLSGEAVRHALAAGDFAAAADLIDPLILPVMRQGEHATLQRWAAALPAAVLATRPALCLNIARAALFVGDIDGTATPLALAEAAWHAAGDDRRLADVLVFRANVAMMQGDGRRAIALADQALARIPPDNRYDRGVGLVQLGGGYLAAGDVRAAEDILRQARTVCAESDAGFGVLYPMVLLAEAHIAHGRLHEAAALGQEVVARAEERLIWHRGKAHGRLLGTVYREWNDLAAAAEQLRQAISLGEATGQLIFMAPEYLALARLHRARGEEAEALAALDRAEEAARRLGAPPLRLEAQALRARLWLDQGDLPGVERWVQTCGMCVDDDPGYERESAYLLLVRLYIAQGRPRDVLPLLTRLLQEHEAAERMGRAIAVGALTAVAHWTAGAQDAAFAALERALSWAEPEGYVRVFVEEVVPMAAMLATILGATPARRHATWRGVSLAYLQALLASCLQDADGAGVSSGWHLAEPGGLAEPLSTREREVLQLLAAGLANEEMAQRLYVTTGTIKTHLKSIYGKLGVHTRTEAVARARALTLL